MAIPTHDARRICIGIARASLLTQSTDGRTDVLTEKHGADGFIGFETLALRGDKTRIGCGWRCLV